jgi:hypothetical protein
VQTIGSAWKTFSERDSEFERQVERVALPVIADAADGARRQGRFRVLTWQDTTEATLASAQARARHADSEPPPLGTHLILGPDWQAMARNSARNLEENRTRLFNAVLER